MVPGPKMSAMILNLANAELEDCEEAERDARIEGVVAVAVLGWNSAVSSELKGGRAEAYIQRMLDKSSFEPGLRADIFETARRFAIRKQWLYPDVHRFVVDAHFRPNGDGGTLDVCSVMTG